MAIKTFTSGEVLTASDTNTYLANSGLVFVKSQTIGNAVGSIVVTDAFSSTYDNYKIVVAGGAASAFAPLTIQLGATAGNYNYSLVYATYATNAVAGACSAGATSIVYVGQSVTSQTMVSLEINGPNLAARTGFSAPYFDATNAGHMSGYLNNTTQYTGFTISTTGGTLTGGTLTVYGYRKG
jgi:hypothetical protein